MAHHILLIEDNPARGQRIQKELHSYGLSVGVVGRIPIPELLKLSRQSAAVLLSVDALRDESYHLCHSIKADPHTAHVPVMMLSRDDDPRQVLAAFRAGAQDYILRDTFVIHNLVESFRRLNLL
jgi:two-component system cell cycle response regulator